MPDTVTRLPRRRSRLAVAFRWWWLLIALAAVFVVGVAQRVFDDPPVVAQVTFVNQTVYAMDVSVTDAHRDGWIGLATAQRDTTTVVQDVIDQGNTWIFHFVSQGQDGGAIQLTKDQLRASGWRVVIPASVGGRLVQLGAPPTPAVP